MLLSCSKIAPEEVDRASDSVSSAQQSFAAILSAAVSENPSLRTFIHTTALEQFDNDYDVFYPFVKNSVIEKNLTFRDILLNYTDEETLSSIEMTLPKLTILVPDWSWIGGFSVNSWDPSSDVAVSFNIPDGYIGVYYQGEYLGELPDESFPDFPVLIIKDNERIVYSPGTKGGEAQYDFVDAAFSNTQTKVEHQYSEVLIDGTPDISNFVPEQEVNYRVREAFSYFSGSSSCYQRDYLYYNMTAANQTKARNDNIWERVYKFKFNSYASSFLHDDVITISNRYFINYDLDAHPEKKKVDNRKNYDWKTAAELRSEFYADGKLDLLFLISIPAKSSGVFTTQKVTSVSFGDVFAIDHADLDYRHRTLFCRDWFVYTIKASYIKPRWCILNWTLPRWDISQESSMITINVAEFDETGSSEFTYTTKKTITNNFKLDTDISNIPIGDSAKLKVGLGYSFTDANESSSTKKFTRTQGGVDALGQTEWDYLTPIVKSRIYKNNTWGYEINTITTGTVDFMILPYSY
ncbi:MAG: hypothetical protein K6E35_06165 [Bacteroidales bacterium]|nr:hypothetical protein [Bacteroidales bacterium]